MLGLSAGLFNSEYDVPDSVGLSMYLFFDTETNGMPHTKTAPASDTDNWPRIVQIAWLLTDEDGMEVRSQASIVRPDGFQIPADAARVHGITRELALRHGTPIEEVLNALAKDLESAQTLIAHNAQFDGSVIGAEFYRARNGSPLEGKKLFCTMQVSAEFCRIYGKGGYYKWQSLAELHERLFGGAFESAHKALADVQACAKCFFELKRRGIITGNETPNPRVRWEPEPYDESDESDDEQLLDEVQEYADNCSWFDTTFVDSVRAQFEERRRITTKQREALIRIRDMLESKQ
jgi:DNA polymerase III epsilon subunit-like protein